MCGRATLSNHDLNDVLEELDAEFSTEDASLFRPRYNIAPSDTHWIVEAKGDRRVLVPAMWGYLASASSRLLINVRGEQVASGGGFRRAFDARRCVMVTDGFFEWDQRRMPYWYHRPDGGLILMAGLSQAPGAEPPGARGRAGGHASAEGHASTKEQTGPRFPRFTVLTTRPNQLVAQVHNRMPVIIPPDRLDLWLTAEPAAAGRLIAPAPEDALVATAVSRRVNSVKNDDPGCLTPAATTDAPPPAPPRQGSLF